MSVRTITSSGQRAASPKVEVKMSNALLIRGQYLKAIAEQANAKKNAAQALGKIHEEARQKQEELRDKTHTWKDVKEVKTYKGKYK